MSQAYERFAKRKVQGQKKANPNRLNLKKISFDDSDDTSRSDIPNIFLAEKSEVGSPVLNNKDRRKEYVKEQSQQQLRNRRQVIQGNPSVKKQALEIERKSQSSQEQQDIPEPEVQIQPHTSLSFLQIIQLYLGEYLFRNTFPMRKIIYVNNNNEDQNEQNRKEFQIKFKNQEREISHFDNSLSTTYPFFLTILILRNIFSYSYIYIWIAIIVLQSVAQNLVISRPIQYGTEKSLMIVLLVIAVILQFVADLLALRKRRQWEDNKNSYQVYHHNGHLAEWTNHKAFQIKSGHIYKILPGQYAPTDCILLHSERSLIMIKESHILSGLSQAPSDLVMKQTLLKGENISLPLSGHVAYQISNPEYSDFQVMGKMNLEEPQKSTHHIAMCNFILRGSINCSQVQVLCLALQTGIDSILLKNLQYPFQQRKIYEQSQIVKSKKISDQISHQIKQKQSTLLGVPLESRIQSTVYILTFLYILMVGIGVLVNFIYGTTGNEYYMSQSKIPIIYTLIYHLTNFIIFIPVLLIPIYKLQIAIAGFVVESRVSKRSIDILGDNQRLRRTNSVSGQLAFNQEESLDNRKIIFPIKIKDHNMLANLGSIDTIVTTIDTFRDESAFNLHSIKVKGVNHNFATTKVDDELYSTAVVEDLKKFMSVALLTTCRNDQRENIHYDLGIELAAKRYLDLKKVKNAFSEISINNSQDLRVKLLFYIQSTYEYPFKVVFLEPVGEIQDNPEVLVLLRGDPKTILDKTYGKQVQLTAQSRKLYEQKHLHVELVAKTSVRLNEVMEIQRAYTSNSIQNGFFFKNLDKFISKVQPMGLLIFASNYFQKRLGESDRNPILNKSLAQNKLPRGDYYEADLYSSENLPNMIILSPNSKAVEAQSAGFQSLHAITSLLTNPYLFNLPISQIGDKILQQKPSNIEKMIQKLDTQEILVWDGWDQKDITYTLDILKKYGRRILFYIQKDEYMYLMKQVDVAVKGGKKGYDAHKYSDISLSSQSTISYLYLTQLINYDAALVKSALISVFFTQVTKFVFYFIIEFIHFFYTRGSGLAIIKSPLYILIQIVLILDVFYYVNWSDSMRAETFNKRESFSFEIFVRTMTAICQATFITLISLYGLQSPTNSTGAIQSFHFTYFSIIFSFLHLLIFEKIFNIFSKSFSLYRAIVILVQILLVYIGLIIISSTDTYHFAGILGEALSGKVFVNAVCCVWICLTIPALRLLFQLLKSRKLRKGDKLKKNSEI